MSCMEKSYSTPGCLLYVHSVSHQSLTEHTQRWQLCLILQCADLWYDLSGNKPLKTNKTTDRGEGKKKKEREDKLFKGEFMK